MPDPSAIAGTPLPAPELPDRAVTVRVVRERMGNNVPGQTVTLKVGTKKFSAALKGGVATFKIGKVPSKKKLKVRATYAGDSQYAGGSARHTYAL